MTKTKFLSFLLVIKKNYQEIRTGGAGFYDGINTDNDWEDSLAAVIMR